MFVIFEKGHILLFIPPNLIVMLELFIFKDFVTSTFSLKSLEWHAHVLVGLWDITPKNEVESDKRVVDMWLSCSRRNVRFVCLRNEVAPACVALLYVRNVMLRKKEACVHRNRLMHKECLKVSKLPDLFNSVRHFRRGLSETDSLWSIMHLYLLIPEGKRITRCCKHLAAATEPQATHGDNTVKIMICMGKCLLLFKVWIHPNIGKSLSNAI